MVKIHLVFKDQRLLRDQVARFLMIKGTKLASIREILAVIYYI